MTPKILFFDTETTGLDPAMHSIIQFGGLYLKNNSWSKIELFCQPISYDNISPEAIEKNRIDLQKMKTFMTNKDAYYSIRNFLLAETADGEKIVPAGYNIKFDLKMLEAMFKYHDPQDSICKFFSFHSLDMYEIIKISKALGFFSHIPNHKLESFFPVFGVSSAEAHDALADIQVTVNMFLWFQKILHAGIQATEGK